MLFSQTWSALHIGSGAGGLVSDSVSVGLDADDAGADALDPLTEAVSNSSVPPVA
jgi:hypothetical protein